MSERVFCFGGAGSPDMLRLGGSTDDGVAVLARARTAEVAPAGVGGECRFTKLYLAVSFTQPFTIRVQPVVDGEVPANEYAEITVTDTPAKRTTYKFEVGLSLPYPDAATERFRHAMVGCYFQAEIAMVSALPAEGDLIFEHMELEYEPVRVGAGIQ